MFQNNFPYVIGKETNNGNTVQNSYGKRYIKSNTAEDKNMITSPSWETNDYLEKEKLQEELYEGLLIDILNRLAKDLNFNYVLRTNLWSHGSLDKTSGNWSGIIGQLVERVRNGYTISNIDIGIRKIYYE